MLGIVGLFFVAPAAQAEPLTCNIQTFSGEDDTAHQMNLPFSLYLGETDYNTIYLTTNATMTFGTPDANYWSYPSTPSVSLAGWDWVTWGEGAYVSYGYNSDSFCIEWSVRPFPQSTGELTQIRLVVQKFSDGHWHGEIVTFGWLPDNNRRGIVATQNGTPLPIEAAFDVNLGVPVEVEPAPVPSDFNAPVPTYCWDGSAVYEPDVCPVQPSPTPTLEPSPEPTQTVEPTPTTEPSQQPLEPSPQPSESASESFLEPSPSSTPYPSSSPLESQLQPVAPRVAQSQSPEPETSSPAPLAPVPSESPSPDQDETSIPLPSDNNITTGFVVLENGVVLTKEVAEALEVFESLDLLLAAMVTDPGKLVTAFLNVGADMTPEQREEAQVVTISVIIYAQIMNGLSSANNIGRKL